MISGQEVLLTQPALRASPWIEALRQAGFQARHWPLTELVLQPSLDLADLRRRIQASRWTLLPSPGAVSLLMQAFLASGLSWPACAGIGLIGPGSRQALQPWLSQVAGLVHAPLCCPDRPPYDASALLALEAFQKVDDQPILMLHRADGRSAWIRELLARGARIEVRALYLQRSVQVPDTERAWMIDRAKAMKQIPVGVASRGAGEALLDTACDLGVAAWLCDQEVLTQHPSIAHALRQLGYCRVSVHEPGVDDFMRVLRALESRPS